MVNTTATGLNYEAVDELLRDYALFTGRPLYLTWRPADSWELLHRYSFRLLGEYVAVLDDRNPKDAGYWIITDAVSMKEFPDTAREIPTAAVELVAHFARVLGIEAGRWELSDGWAASIKRFAALAADA